MLILKHDDVRTVLDGREAAVLDAVRRAYLSHHAGRTALPHSVFLRFPGTGADRRDSGRDRIIGLPGFLAGDGPGGPVDGNGGAGGVAGMKWVASFPGNLDRGLPRASAVIVTNSPETGRPETFMEGSLISARRTGASAALAAALLPGDRRDRAVSLIGCGVINFEVLRFLRVSLPALDTVTLFDSDPARHRDFAARCAAAWPDLGVGTTDDVAQAVGRNRLVSIATTAVEPHLGPGGWRPGTLVLHVSLRDLTPACILTSRNVVDDADHVCRENTSVHLAERLSGGDRGFIHHTIGELLAGERGARRDPAGLTVFSPFGLGVLDLAVADLVRTAAIGAGIGVQVPGFLP
jgi:2,3-diaminopropionate biosynthesis protein SbnB